MLRDKKEDIFFQLIFSWNFFEYFINSKDPDRNKIQIPNSELRIRI